MFAHFFLFIHFHPISIFILIGWLILMQTNTNENKIQKKNNHMTFKLPRGLFIFTYSFHIFFHFLFLFSFNFPCPFFLLQIPRQILLLLLFLFYLGQHHLKLYLFICVGWLVFAHLLHLFSVPGYRILSILFSFQTILVLLLFLIAFYNLMA